MGMGDLELVQSLAKYCPNKFSAAIYDRASGSYHVRAFNTPYVFVTVDVN
jgi:hypothetical protein